MRSPDGGDNSGTGYEDGQYSFVLYNCAVLRHQTYDEITPFVFSFHYNNKLNDPIVRSLVINGTRVFNDFIAGVKSYTWKFLACKKKLFHTDAKFSAHVIFVNQAL